MLSIARTKKKVSKVIIIMYNESMDKNQITRYFKDAEMR